MNNNDYILNTDDETGKQSVECRECGCVTDMDTYKDEGALHWKPCSKMSDSEPIELDEFNRQQDR